MTTRFAWFHQVSSRVPFAEDCSAVTAPVRKRLSDIGAIALGVGVILGAAGCAGDVPGGAPMRKEGPTTAGASHAPGVQATDAQASLSLALADEHGRAMAGLRVCAYTYGSTCTETDSAGVAFVDWLVPGAEQVLVAVPPDSNPAVITTTVDGSSEAGGVVVKRTIWSTAGIADLYAAAGVAPIDDRGFVTLEVKDASGLGRAGVRLLVSTEGGQPLADEQIVYADTEGSPDPSLVEATDSGLAFILNASGGRFVVEAQDETGQCTLVPGSGVPARTAESAILIVHEMQDVGPSFVCAG
jgi:hypothetical protein